MSKARHALLLIDGGMEGTVSSACPGLRAGGGQGAKRL